MIDSPSQHKHFSVSQLNLLARDILEQTLQKIWVEGELADLASPRSGHHYFTLKDESAQIRCALFKHQAAQLPFKLEHGQQIKVLAKVSIYPTRGDYQLIVERVQSVGAGVLERALQKLKQHLTAQGLFAPERKQQLPARPQCIGVISSASGAALQDILQVLRRRAAHIPICVYHCTVQGHRAAPEIVAAITQAQQQARCDALIIARGGGSLEDLWPFNEEMVVRAIADCKIPIISGIGHATDTALSDLAADIHAPTPSAAAEIISQWYAQLPQLLQHWQQQLHTHIKRQLLEAERSLMRLQQNIQQLHPQQILKAHQFKLHTLAQQLQQQFNMRLLDWQQKLERYSIELEHLNPLHTLKRGFATIHKQQQIIHSIKQLKIKDCISAKLIDGEVSCSITAIKASTLQAVDDYRIDDNKT